jgi:hypothetical protein
VLLREFPTNVEGIEAGRLEPYSHGLGVRQPDYHHTADWPLFLNDQDIKTNSKMITTIRVTGPSVRIEGVTVAMFQPEIV